MSYSIPMFRFWENVLLYSIPMLFVMLLAHVGQGSNSRSHMSSKTGALKNFAISTGKNLCWSLFLIKFQDWRPAFLFKKRLQLRCSSVNIVKSLRSVFYWRPVHYTTINFYLMVDNWYFRVIFYYCKIRPHNRKNFVYLFFAISSFPSYRDL